MNVLSRDLMVDFERVYEELRGRADVRAAVLISGKPSGFIAGADITMLAACKTAEEVRVPDDSHLISFYSTMKAVRNMCVTCLMSLHSIIELLFTIGLDSIINLFNY